VFEATGTHPGPEATLGALSLIVWTLIIIATVKYIILAHRVDNEGEGGVLALMALLSRMPGRHRLVLLIGMFGAALVYGDCALTPAFSVLSSLEGLEVIASDLDRYVLPGTVVILAALHAHYGFMERPDLPALLQRAHDRGYPVDPSNVTYFIGRETVVRREDGKGLPWLVEVVFSFLLRNRGDWLFPPAEGFGRRDRAPIRTLISVCFGLDPRSPTLTM
jgi:K+ transporter